MTPAPIRPVTCSPADAHRRVTAREPVELIDVRTPVEHAERHAAGARLVPFGRLDAGTLGCAPGTTPLLLCKSGGRATKAAARLAEAGIDAIVVEGGTDAWAAAGLPLVEDRAVLSLERQVRIVAGLIVLAGALLAWFVHPAFVWLSALVGAGLTFAGITNFCGMALLLAKMPWNRGVSVS